MIEKTLNMGELLFREGDVADFAYIIVSGSVELSYRSQEGEVKLGTLEEGNIAGELAIFDPKELRNQTALALAPVTVKMVTAEEFNNALSQCPPFVKPFLDKAFAKFIPPKTRNTNTANQVVKSDIKQITLSAGSENLKSVVTTMTLTLERLPFRIGGYPEDGERNRKDNVHLSIPSQKNPLVISRQHCELAIENETIVINDLGSRFGTEVNHQAIGRGRGSYTAYLQKGDNSLLLGTQEKGYFLSVHCE